MTTQTLQPVTYWENRLQRLIERRGDRPNSSLARYLKQADGSGGEGSGVDGNGDFEQAFSNLAHAYVRDRAPKLTDYEVGFQLLDKNDEGDRAVGMFGFKVGPNWMYAPVFFLSGKLKGNELLYLKNQDVFVPLRENWINYLLNRRPPQLGEGINRHPRNMQPGMPNLNQISQSPGKFASSKETQQSHAAFAKMVLASPSENLRKLGSHLNLANFLREASLPILHKFATWCRQYPEVGAAFERYHGMNTLAEAVKSAKQRAIDNDPNDLLAYAKRAASSQDINDNVLYGKAPNTKTVSPSVLNDDTADVNQGAAKHDSGKTDDLINKKTLDAGKAPEVRSDSTSFNENRDPKLLQIITKTDVTETVVPRGPEGDQTDDEERLKLLRDGVVIRDDREDNQVSKAYTERRTEALQNPDHTGFFSVLTCEGKFEKCLVLFSPISTEKRQGGAMVCVITLSGTPTYVNVPQSSVFINNADDWADFAAWFKGQASDSLSTDDHAYFIAINDRGVSTCPFTVYDKLDSETGDESYNVSFDDYARRGMFRRRSPTSQQGASPLDSYNGDGCCSGGGGRMYLDSIEGTKIRVHAGDVYIPNDFKIFKVQNGYKDYEDRPRPNFQPGDLMAVEQRVLNKASSFELGQPADFDRFCRSLTQSLTVYSDHSEVEINQRRMSKLAGLIHLVRDHGLREAPAREMLKLADVHRKVSYRVKYADAYGPGFLPEEYQSGNVMNQTQLTQPTQEYTLPVPGAHQRQDVRSIYNPNPRYDGAGTPGGTSDPVAQMYSAVQSGQKEVFDTGMISSLLRSVNDDDMVDRYLGPLMGGLDALGRLLFQFYWHGEEYTERYGKQDMPELEDSLRNSFQALGDLVLFLKQHTIEPYPDEAGTDLQLR